MPNYKNGKIYKLYSPNNPDLGEYIGSTTKSLKRRMGDHKSNFKRYIQGKKVSCYSSFIILECGDAVIELVCNYECETRKELVRKEGEYIKNSGCVNIVIAGRTNAEYRKDNKEKIKEYREVNKQKIREKHKEYYENNKEKIKEYKKKYHEDNKEKIKEYKKKYHEDNKEKRKECNKKYREENKERLKKYYQDNKEKLAEQRKEKIKCECGSIISRGCLSKHRKTKKHHKLLKEL